MKVAFRRLLMLGALVVFCSTFMSITPALINDAYAQMTKTEVKTEKTNTETGGATTGVGSGLNLGGSRCGSQSNPFLLIACKATTTLADLRILVYIISGFGLIAFAFGAIFGKISWKHLSQLAFGLFLVAMMAPFIEYFTGDKTTQLKFGSYLSVDEKDIMGSNNSFGKGDCGKYCLDDIIKDGLDDSKENAKKEGEKIDGEDGDSNETPLAGNENKNPADGKTNPTDDKKDSEKDKWSWNDIKGSAKSAISAAKAGIDIINTAKITAKDIGQQRDKIKQALSGNDGKLGSLISSAGDIIHAGNKASESIHRLDKNLERNTDTINKGVEGAQTGGGRRPKAPKAPKTPEPAKTPEVAS